MRPSPVAPRCPHPVRLTSRGAVSSSQMPKSKRQAPQAAVIHRVLAEGLSRGVVRGRALQNGRAVSIVGVDLSANLAIARVHWEPTEEGAPVRPLQSALERASGRLRVHVTDHLRQRIAPVLEFHPPQAQTPRDAIIEQLFAQEAEEAKAREAPPSRGKWTRRLRSS